MKKLRIYNKIRTFLISLIVIFYFTELSYSQIPEDFIGTWYLEYFSSPQGEIFVNTLDVSQGPSFTVTESLQITGNSFCNDFSGEYIYVNTEPFAIPHTFQPINITRGTIDCGSNEMYETLFYVPFMNEQVVDILVLEEDFLVIQYYLPTLYQVFRDEPVLSIDENELNIIQIYPNPVKDILTIENISNTEITSIMIYDVLGRLVLTENGNVKQLDISQLNSGLLFVIIETDEGVVTKKIIKE
ncbi:MAG: T9SS type A sorting domain-containing protein [Bacteroidetes bacterium]|nr:T9SS type A sorting domain-containing protein [Bacteroidota bacterium]